jgi:hypothetical protein
MQTVDVVLGVLNKSVAAQIWYLRRGPKGYWMLLIFRLLLYSVLKEIFSTRKLIKHLKEKAKSLEKARLQKDTLQKGSRWLVRKI